MDKSNSREVPEYGLDRPPTESPSAPAVGLPEAGSIVRLSPENPCLAKAQRRLSPESASPSTVGPRNEVAATDAQPRQLCHIETIPVEVFQVVMWEITKNYPRHPGPHRKHDHAFTKIRLVCRQWTAILEGMPKVWARLSLDMGDKLIDLALTRSKHCPLTITGDLFPSPALDKLFQHTYRWKHLDVYVRDKCIMDRLAVHSVPLLEELKLNHSVFTPHKILFNGLAPMLRVVHIRIGEVRWSTSLFSNLHELVLLDVRRGSPDFDTFLHILSSSPKLTRLQVHNTVLTHPPSSQTRISLPCLRSLELEYLNQGTLEQLVDAIDIPTSTTCRFIAILLGEWDYHIEQLEPINRRLTTLAEVSRGTKSALTFSHDVSAGRTRTTYEGEADKHGALIAEHVTFYPIANDIFEHFARQLGKGEPNPVPPALHIVNCSYADDGGNELKLLQRLHKHLPDTDEILIEDSSSKFIEDALSTLFPSNHSSGLFPQLSTLTVRNSMDGVWVSSWLEKRQTRQDKQGGVQPLPLQTLKIEGWDFSPEMMKALRMEELTISAESVKMLEKLVPNLVLDRVVVK